MSSIEEHPAELERELKSADDKLKEARPGARPNGSTPPPEALGDWNPGEPPDRGPELAHQSRSAADQWLDVIPLDAYAPMPMPNGILTGWTGNMVEAVSAATETPRELAALIGLAVQGCALQGKFTVRPESGYFEPVNVWTCPALDSGNRRTAVVNALARPLYDWEREKARELEPVIKRVQAERSAVEERIKRKRGEFGRAEDKDLEKIKKELVNLEMTLPEIPRAPRLVAQDITPEHCGTLMAECDERLAIISDEGGIFDILAGRYSRGIPNLDLFLQAHAGAPVRVDRVSRPPVHLHHPALTIGLSPQPEVLRGLAGQPGFRGRGLLARFLYALPQSPLGYRGLDSKPVRGTVADAYANGIKAMLALSPAFDEDGHPRPHVLTLMGKSWREWKELQRAIEADMREGGRLEHITDWASKLPGAMARVAGLFHCAEHAHGQPATRGISADTMCRARALGTVLINHALAVFDLMAGNPALADARKVWRWIERGKLATFTARELHKALEGTFRRRADLDPPLGVLIERGYIREIETSQKGPGRPSKVFEVNPSLRAPL